MKMAIFLGSALLSHIPPSTDRRVFQTPLFVLSFSHMKPRATVSESAHFHAGRTPANLSWLAGDRLLTSMIP